MKNKEIREGGRVVGAMERIFFNFGSVKYLSSKSFRVLF